MRFVMLMLLFFETHTLAWATGEPSSIDPRQIVCRQSGLPCPDPDSPTPASPSADRASPTIISPQSGGATPPAGREIVPGEFSTAVVQIAEMSDELKNLGSVLLSDTVFDGDWYSPALHLGIHVSGKTGIVTITNSPNYGNGDPVLTLGFLNRGHRVGNQITLPYFDGCHRHLDGRWFNIQGRITKAGRLLLVSRNGFFPPFHWAMERGGQGTGTRDQACAANGAIDGVWYSAELGYGLRVCGADGFFTMPPPQPWVNRPDRVLSITGGDRTGAVATLAQPNGRAVNVRAERIGDSQMRISMIGKQGMASNWTAVGGQTAVKPLSEELTAQDKIRRHLRAIPPPPPYLYDTTMPWDQIANLSVGVGASWLRGGHAQEHYDEFYFAALDCRSMAIKSLHQAELMAGAQDQARVSTHINESQRYLKLYQLSVNGANAVRAGDIDAAATLAQGIYTTSKIWTELGATYIAGPWAARLVGGLFMATDFLVDDKELGVDAAAKNLVASGIAHILLSEVVSPSLGNRKISSTLTSQTQYLIGSSRLYPMLAELFQDPEFQIRLVTFLAKSGAYASNKAVSEAISRLLRQLPA